MNSSGKKKKKLGAQSEAGEGGVAQRVCSRSPQNHLPRGNTVLSFCVYGSGDTKM